jgi:RNA-splicing ligase RtcB
MDAMGSKVIARNVSQVHKQMPGAYKDFDKVMFSQTDLVRIVERRTPLAPCKGSDSGRHTKKGATIPDADAPEL